MSLLSEIRRSGNETPWRGWLRRKRTGPCGRNQTGKIRKGIRSTDTVRTAVTQRQITTHFYFSFPIIRLRSKNYRYSKKRDGSYKNIRYFSLRKKNRTVSLYRRSYIVLTYKITAYEYAKCKVVS